MQAERLKPIPRKGRCDRCAGPGPVSECRFDFRHPLAYWRALWEAATGKRLTRLRRAEMGARDDFDWKAPPTFWLDLCGPCWATCSAPWDGLPMDFHRQRLSSGGSPTGESDVLGNSTESAPRALGARASSATVRESIRAA